MTWFVGLVASSFSVLVWLKTASLLSVLVWEMHDFYRASPAKNGDRQHMTTIDLTDYGSYPNTFPFGYRDVQLRRWRKHGALIVKGAATALSAVYKYPVFVITAAGCVTAQWAMRASDSGIHFDTRATYILCVSVMVCGVVVTVLATLSYALDASTRGRRRSTGTTREYPNAGRFFAQLALQPRVGELATIAGTIVLGWVGAWAAFSLISKFSNGIAGISPKASVIDRLLGTAYLTSSTFTTVGFGDVHPNNSLSEVVAMCLEAEAFLIVVVVFALISLRDGTGNDQASGHDA